MRDSILKFLDSGEFIDLGLLTWNTGFNNSERTQEYSTDLILG